MENRSIFRGAVALRRVLFVADRDDEFRGEVNGTLQPTAVKMRDSRGAKPDMHVNNRAPVELQSSAEIRAQHARLWSPSHVVRTTRPRLCRRKTHRNHHSGVVRYSPELQALLQALIRDCNRARNMADASAPEQSLKKRMPKLEMSDRSHTSYLSHLHSDSNHDRHPVPSLPYANTPRRTLRRVFPVRSPASAAKERSQPSESTHVLSASTASFQPVTRIRRGTIRPMYDDRRDFHQQNSDHSPGNLVCARPESCRASRGPVAPRLELVELPLSSLVCPCLTSTPPEIGPYAISCRLLSLPGCRRQAVRLLCVRLPDRGR